MFVNRPVVSISHDELKKSKKKTHFFNSVLMGKRNATVKICHVLHVAHNHELHKLNMTRILSQASGLF